MTAIVLTAPLAADAEHRMTRDGQHLLMLRLALPNAGANGRAVVVHGVRAYGSGHAAGYAARSAAHHLRRGVRVTCSGTAIAWRRGAAHMAGLSIIQAPDLDAWHRHPATGDQDP